jgi:ribulose-5-phosphate 4-epimerase/fuculose-1-phosphate aldolase
MTMHHHSMKSSAQECTRSLRKRELAVACRLFAQFGFEQGAAGHLSARDPEEPDSFWLNPFGLPLARIQVSSLIRVDHAGFVRDGVGSANPPALVIHAEIHARRPDVVGVAHAHSLFGKTWSTLHRPLDPITQDACAFFEDHAVFTRYHGLFDDRSEGVSLADTLAANKAAILANHGLLTVGRSVGAAAWWLIAMDRCCHSQLLAEAAGHPIAIPPDVARRVCATVGAELAAERHFSGLFELLVAQQPDVLT